MKENTLVFKPVEECISEPLRKVTDKVNKIGHKAPYERLSNQEQESTLVFESVTDKISEPLRKVAEIVNKIGHKAPYERLSNQEQESALVFESATDKILEPLNKVEAEAETSISIVSPTNRVGLKMEPAIIMLDIDGNVINEEEIPEQQTPIKFDNSAVIDKYPSLTILSDIIYKLGFDVVFTESPNIIGYINADVLNDGNKQISFTVDLNGNYMSPDEKIFIPSDGVTIAIEFSNIKLFEKIVSGKHIDNISLLDLYTERDKEINELINLATLPELVNSNNRRNVISTLLRDGFQTSLFNAKKVDPQVYFIFGEYKSPNNFKLISINPSIPISIVYNGRQAVLSY